MQSIMKEYPIAQRLIDRGEKVNTSKRVDLEGTYPFVIDRGDGAYLHDVDGNKYIDYTSSTGAVVLGYRYPFVDDSVCNLIRTKGTILPTTISSVQVELAEALLKHFPHFQKALFYKTGSCATTAAIRLAKVHSGKNIVLTSGYHGWHDWHLHIFPRFELEDHFHFDFRYNLNLLEKQLHDFKDKVACIIVTPDPNFFDVDYLIEIKKIAQDHNVILIFDEVMCGFRYELGGYHKKMGVYPDMVVVGKGLANGYGLASVIGKEEIINAREETHLVGTFHNEMTPLAAALATLQVFEKEDVIGKLHKLGGLLREGLNRLFKQHGLRAIAHRTGSIFHIIFEDEGFEETYIRRMHSRGVLLHPFDPQMITFSHTEQDVLQTLSIADEVLHELSKEYPHHFSHPNGGAISKEGMEFRTAHELGGWLDYRRPVSELPDSWEQVDR